MEQTTLARFVDAQNRGQSFAQALQELRAGRKTGHWIWWVFPQLRGLGRSELAWFYGLRDLEEARAYLSHPLLGPRLHEAAHALHTCGVSDPQVVLGALDAVKVRSSMTLFLQADAHDGVVRAVLEDLYGGVEDAKTLRMLNGTPLLTASAQG